MAARNNRKAATPEVVESVETVEVAEAAATVETPETVEAVETPEAVEVEGTEEAEAVEAEAPKAKSTTRNAAVMEAKRVALKRLKAEHPEMHAQFQALWDEEKAKRGIQGRQARTSTVTVLKKQTDEQAARIAELEAALAALAPTA
jgi:hypothetical protein